METKHIHTAWAVQTMREEDIEQVKADGKIYELEKWIEDELARAIFRQLRDKVSFRMEHEADGVVEYKAWLVWYDESAALKEAYDKIQEKHKKQ